MVQGARPGLLMLLARALARGREVAIRTALGASRGKLMQQFLTEAVVLGLIGGALGMLLAVWGIDLLDKIVPPSIRIPNSNGDVMWPPPAIDGTVLLFTLGVSIVTCLVFGLAPAFAATRGDVQKTLRDRSRGASASSQSKWMRDGLVVSEIALALVLPIASGMTISRVSRRTICW